MFLRAGSDLAEALSVVEGEVERAPPGVEL